jgi:hypothetical protein
MTAQQAAGWSRREFLQRLTLAGAAGMAFMSSRPDTAVEVQQTRRPTDTSSAVGVCLQPTANTHDICPNCCHYRDESM